jgi:peroxiredoxin Q/BCP
VIFFYPKDMTEDCTIEACAFDGLSATLAKAGAAVVGVSHRPRKDKVKFAAKAGVSIPLLADERLGKDGTPDPAMAPAYGVWVEKSMYGKKYHGIARTTFLIGPDGIIRRRWDKVDVPGHAEEVCDALRAMR